MPGIDQEISQGGQENARWELKPASTPQMESEDSCDNTEERQTPLPKFQLFLTLLIQFAEPITAIVIYPFINQFVRDIGITKGDETKTGYFAGVIESAFFFAEAATVFQWGQLSDRYGRRPILLLGPLGLTFAMLKFGYSTSFWSMVGSRWMQGVFNGSIGVSKTVMVELTDSTNVGDAFAMIPLMWSIGSTVAPIIGGSLSKPATRWPNVFGKFDLFKKLPYLLPCIAASCISFFTFILGFLGLNETHHLIAKNGELDRDTGSEDESKRLEACPTDPLLRHDDVSDYGSTSSTRCPSPTSSEGSSDSCVKSNSQNAPAPPTLRSVLMSRTMQVLVINYAFFVYTDMSCTVLIPLIYSTSIANGGLGLTPHQTGVIMGIWGFANAFVQINVLGKLIRKHGSYYVYKVTYACFMGVILTLPVSTYFARRDGAVGIATSISILVQLLFQCCAFMSYGASHVSIAEFAPKELRGSINGLFQMTACLMRTIAPAFASSLFSWCMRRRILDGNLVYLVFVFITAAGVGFSLTLPSRKGKPTAK